MQQGAEAGHPPLSGVSLALLTVALPLATFMQVLDTTIANVAVPTIAGNLGASTTQGTWVITSYSVANAISLPITGPLARRLGEVRLFLLSAGLFALTSLLCGLSTSLGMLVAFRVLQGAVSGPMLSLAQSLLIVNYPQSKKNMAIALWGMTVSIAPILGPLLGGWISDNVHWGWIFFINVPVGVVVVVVCWALLKDRESRRSAQPMSRVGLVLLVLGVGALQIMLDRGKELDWFNSTEILVLGITAVVSLAFLIVFETTDAHPVVDLKLFTQRNFTIGVVCISLGMMIFMGTVVLLPLLLQSQYAYTATLAGLAAAPIGVLQLPMAPIVGKNMGRVDLRVLATLGFGIFAACMYTRSWFSPMMDIEFVMIPQFFQGIAHALFFAPLTALAFSRLKPHQMAGAAGLFNCVRVLFAAIGTSVYTTLWERREALHHTRLTERVDIFSPYVRERLEGLQSLGMDALQSSGYVAGKVTQQSFIIAANELYWLSAVGFLLLVGVVWFADGRRGGAGGPGGPGGPGGGGGPGHGPGRGR
ncbi:MAG: DHA2 family efflux MFS transporter permease subunit [Desulfovibrio sp.]|jgi:DHA2 family multidrug resistance protein|nr:DHA2 family efflux MFS transporter permease subunit [Desulfovibrio sp.]